jgi:nucleoid-associated protein YgaU
MESQEARERVRMKRGDHLWKIAQTHYGSGYRHTDIAAANNIIWIRSFICRSKIEAPLFRRTT